MKKIIFIFFIIVNKNNKNNSYKYILMDKSLNEQEKPDVKEGSTFAEYPPTVSQGIKSSMAPSGDKKNLNESTGYNSMEGEYKTSTSNNIGAQPPKEGSTFAEYPPTASQGIKSSMAPSGDKKNLNESTGYNSMEGEYKSSTSNNIGAQPPKEGSTFAEYPPTASQGIKSSMAPSGDKKNLNESTGYSSIKKLAQCRDFHFIFDNLRVGLSV